MNYTEVRAPTDGIILSRIREPGTVVNPADPVYTLSVCFSGLDPRLCRRAAIRIDLLWHESGDLHRQRTRSIQGKIGFISPVAEFTPKTVETTQLRTDLVYRLRVYADNPDRYLKQGMPVTVKLQLQNEEKK